MLIIDVAGKQGRSRFEHPSGPFVMGREPAIGAAHGVIADSCVSARQMRLVELADGRLRLENLSQKVPIGLLGGGLLVPGEVAELDLPARLKAGSTWVNVASAPSDSRPGEILSSLEPSGSAGSDVLPPSGLEEPPPPAWFSRWFEALLDIQRAAATRDDFYRDAARAVVRLVGLDCGIVLLHRGGEWQAVARAGRDDGPVDAVSFSRTILDRALLERRTFYRAAAVGGAIDSLAGVEAVVVSPIPGSGGSTAVGAIYGVRLTSRSGFSAEVRPLEAQLVQLLAAAVGAGIARLGAEAEASRRLVQFEQFFSCELARELEADPSLLDGRERRITALFSDIRGFSSISERLAPREVCRLVGEVMECLTARIRDHAGVVVDYVGDGLLAMWNAPADQPDHALLACRAARAMAAELPGLNDRWSGRVGKPLRLGIGLNTGEALVGNTGSRSRFKYGPLGHAVNLASRVEGATKQFGVSILLTDSTHADLGGALPTRRLCRVRVVGIAGPVGLHELSEAGADDGWAARRDAYEAGLARFEAGDLTGACRILYSFADAHGDGGGLDVPSLTLVGRAIEQLRAPERTFDPIIELTTK